jgi:hypothetical protein
MFAVVDSVECASCGGRHTLCVALDNYSPAAVYEYFCPRTNEEARATPHKDCARAKACPWKAVYAKRVDQ